ncbi:TPA: sialidase domain-containing protein [Staphylococcus pseudintermedius]
MKAFKLWIAILSLLLIIDLVTPNAFAQVVEQKNESNTLVFERDNIQLTGNGMDITSSALNKLTEPDFTVIIKYHQLKLDGIQALFGISNSKKDNQNSYLDMYVRENGELGMEARDTNTKTNHLVSRPASVWGKYKNKPATNTVAFVSNHHTKTYALFSNGYKVEEKKINNFLMLSDIKGVDSFVIGGVNREGKNSFGFNGTIENIKIFNNALDENTIKSMTANNITQRLIYQADDETHSNYFRIPSLYTLSNGRVLSSIDARYGGTHDFLNKINIATSYSDDNGNSWTKPKLTLSFDDFASVPLEWPRDPDKRDWQISGGATYIDSVLLEKKDKQVMLFADVMPAGVSFRDAVRNDSGFKKINGKYYLKLKKSGENEYQYSVREKGIIYDDKTNRPTEYSVDKDFAISKNNEKLMVEQYSAKVIDGQKTEFKNGKFVDMNVFL